jgi:hypothetical protein
MGWLALPDISHEIMSMERVPQWSRQKALACLYHHHRDKLKMLKEAGIEPFLPNWLGGAGCAPMNRSALAHVSTKARMRASIISATKNRNGEIAANVSDLMWRYGRVWDNVDKTGATVQATRKANLILDHVRREPDRSHGGVLYHDAHTKLKVALTTLLTRNPFVSRVPALHELSIKKMGARIRRINDAVQKLWLSVKPMAIRNLSKISRNPPSLTETYVNFEAVTKLLKDIHVGLSLRENEPNQDPLLWIRALFNEVPDLDTQSTDDLMKLIKDRLGRTYNNAPLRNGKPFNPSNLT